MKECGQRPVAPWDHWACQRGRFHIGRHRFNNYTWRHGATTWGLLRYAAGTVRLKVTRAEPWRVVVRRTATKYDPVPWKLPTRADSLSESAPPEAVSGEPTP